MFKKISKVIISLLTVVATLLSVTACGKLPAAVDPIDDNYRVFYQIFVGSFSDSNGDGIGDIRGIINRFDYLNDGNINSGESLGVQGIWLSPVFKSPTYHKYDAQDYYQIDPDFGTEADLKELIALCHERNVKIILDLAINHNSTQNEWFKKFTQARNDYDVDNEYYDFYTAVSKDEMVRGSTYVKIPSSPYGEYYECNFDTAMPELNFDNENAKKAVLDVAKYYLNLGVDGFRFDAIKYIYYGDTAKSAAFWDWYVGELKAVKPDIYTVGECWSGDTEVLEYYDALNCFNFTSAGVEGYIASSTRVNMSTEKVGQKINVFTGYVTDYLKQIKERNADAMYCPFLSNHDTDRSAGYVTPATYGAQMAANLYVLCQGSPFIYYGEEIGMKGTRGAENTDANRRLAMLWGDGDTVKNPEGSTYDSKYQINGTVSEQLKDDDSLLRYYQKLIRFRIDYPEIARGNYAQLRTDNDYVGGFIIEYNGEKTYLIHNTALTEATVDLSEYGDIEIQGSIGRNDAKLKKGKLTIGAQTSVVIK